MLRFLSFSAFILCGLLTPPASHAVEPDGSFVVVSDIHFDPFSPPELARSLASSGAEEWMARIGELPGQAASQWGSDTNHVLLVSALDNISTIAAGVDFAIVPGDLLSHGFEADTSRILGVAAGSGKQRAFARRTTMFVAEALGRALPDKPVILALGNNDSECGDYEIEPGGDYLSAMAETVRRLAGPDLVAADFGETYRAGGYYALRHPTVPDTTIIVVNDVLWSQKYRNACGLDDIAAAQAQMQWLAGKLAESRASGGKVWMVHHIPWGIDPYSTEHATAATCAGQTVPLLNAAFAGDFLALLRRYAGIIETSLSGHLHTDDFRLLRDDAGRPVGLDKVAPAISPVFGQNPGFQIFSYDVKTGVPSDYTSYYLADLPSLTTNDGGAWREEYVFSQAYGLDGYSPASVAALVKSLDEPGRARDAYTGNYDQRHGVLATGLLPAYACAIGNLDPEAFAGCFCDR